MSFRSLEQGIKAIQQGNKEEGARLIKIALRDDNIQGSVRATGLLWLAETTSDNQKKMNYYNNARAADPENEHVQQRISLLLAQGLPSTQANPTVNDQDTSPATYGAQAGSTTTSESTLKPSPGHTTPPQTLPGQQTSTTQTQQPISYPNTNRPQPVNPVAASRRPAAFNFNPDNVYRTVGIIGGPNGRGSGFFITRDGLVATTRFVVGGEVNITVELDPGNAMTAQVVRAYPELDLAFIHTGLRINKLPQVFSAPILPDSEPLTALAHNQRAMSGYRRATRSETKPEWFPTTIGELNDAGGNPVFNDNHLLVGMLTHNANRTSPYVFGLFIGTIFRYVEYYAQELRSSDSKLVYCPGCGYLSRAGGAGSYYCEACGSVLPYAEDIRRAPQPQMSGYYGEHLHRPCPNCNARVGYHKGICLRCGYDVNTQRVR